MKSIIVTAVVLVAVYFGFIYNEHSSLIFNNEEYKLVRKEGTDEFQKFHYTKSGRDRGMGRDDYIEILKIDKSGITAEKAAEATKFIESSYQSKKLSGVNGRFGVFGTNNKQYAYLVKSESNGINWYINYVVQSGSISKAEAKLNIDHTIKQLEILLASLK